MRRPILGALLSFGVLLGAASIGSGGCAYDWALPADGTGTDGGSRPDSPLADVFIRDSTLEDRGEDTAPPLPTACKSSLECTADRYCRFVDHFCGEKAAGTCEVVPKVGCSLTEYVCSCEAMTYKTSCDAIQAREDLSALATDVCTPPVATFRCGYRFCTETKEFCVETKGATSIEYKCGSFLATCNPLDCSCITIKNLACTACDDAKVGQVKVMCP